MSNKKPTSPPSDPSACCPREETILATGLARADPDQCIRFCFNPPSRPRFAQAEVHTGLQDFLTQHRRALIELPRDHGKTFQVCCRVLWELGRNPMLRVRIVCATAAIARERLRFLRNQIAGNHRLRQVFPGLRPGLPWGEDSFTVRRPESNIGPSVAAYGVGGGSTGTRADLLICDDIVDVRSLHSRIERERAAEFFENNLMHLLEPDGRFWGLFTPWHGDDINARLKRRHDVFALFRRSIDDDLTPVWPQKWPRERLEERLREIGPASFARGYRLMPVTEEEVPIQPQWVKFWQRKAEYETVVLSIDPAVSTKAKADRSAFVVLGTASRKSQIANLKPQTSENSEISKSNQNGIQGSEFGFRVTGSPEVHVLDAHAERLAAPDLVTRIDDLDRLWNPDVILFESNAAFAGIKDLLVRHALFGPKVKGEVQSRDKASRAAAFGIPVRNGYFFLKGDLGGDEVDPSQRDLFEEMTNFPFHDHDDLLDAAMTGYAYLMRRPEPRVFG
jgi:hypothetical protein